MTSPAAVCNTATLSHNDNGASLDVDIYLTIYPEAWGWWIDTRVVVNKGETKGRTLYDQTIFSDGRGCYEYLPKPSDSKYSFDISKMIKSTFEVWVEKLELGK